MKYSTKEESIFGVQNFKYASRIFKLADRMRSMRTTGASKNRDWPGKNAYGVYTYGVYTYGVYTYCVYTYGVYT